MAGRATVLLGLLRDKKPVVGAEVGVQAGDTSIQLLKGLPSLKRLYCVDAWRWYPEYDHDRCPTDKTGGRWPDQELLDAARETFLRRMIAGGFQARVVMMPMFSVDAAEQVADASLDFVFLDANHSYEFVRQDIELWRPKVRRGGLLAGHDYRNLHNPRWGVTEAVGEAFPQGVSVGDDFTWWVWNHDGRGGE